MAITRRETELGPRCDVEWRLPDRSKRRKPFKTEREARVFQAAIVTKSVSGGTWSIHGPAATRSRPLCVVVPAGFEPATFRV
jgi:hypothetical protein